MVVAAFVQLDRLLKRARPTSLTALIAAFAVVPLPIPEYAVLAPNFALMAVFYWTVHRPDLFPAWGVFLIGLLADSLSGAPLGLNALVLLLVHFTLVAQHKVFRGKAFWLIWLAFVMVAAGAHVLAAVLGWVFRGGLPGGPVFVAQLALTVALYPALATFLGRVQRHFLADG